MFESHPIPQQISSYQFRLVGDMTLKQFFQLARGGLDVASFLFHGPAPHYQVAFDDFVGRFRGRLGLLTL